MVSTDSIEIANIAREYGAEVPFLRSSKNSDDYSTTVDVLVEVLEEYKNIGMEFEYACCIYPTAIFTDKEKLQKSFDILIDKNVDTVLPITEFSYPPQRCFITEKDNKVYYKWPEFERSRSQDLEKFYHDCGQFYMFRVSHFLKNKSLISKNTIPIFISNKEVQDIDNLEDWDIAEEKYKRINGSKEVIIFTEGGSKFGLGHISRCLSLYDECIKRDMKVKFVISGDNSISEFIGDRNYTIAKWHSNIENFIKTKNIYCIIDSYHADIKDYEYISKNCNKSIFIDDNNRIEYPFGIVLNFAINAENIYLNKGCNTEYLLGLKYAIVRKAFRSPVKKIIKETITDILVIMGGADIKNVTPATIKYIRNYMPDDINIHIVIGAGFKNKTEIYDIIKNSKSNKNIYTYENINEWKIFELMLQCDIAISALGQTVYELMACGLPFAGLQIADNQHINTQGLLSNNIIDGYGIVRDDMTVEEKIELIKSSIDPVISFDNRQRLHSTMLNYDISSGIKNIFDKVF